MKTTALLTLATLLTSALALPSASPRHYKRQSPPSPDQTTQAIQRWFNDVTNVNDFLNLAHLQDPINLKLAAQDALINANDEPVELMILAGFGDALGAAGQQAVLTLQEIFGNVPSSLQNIIDNPGDAQNVATQLEQINGVRCCSVLPSLDTLWPAAAAAAGVTNPEPTVPRENACTDGTTQC